jgi:hypothetical protein
VARLNPLLVFAPPWHSRQLATRNGRTFSLNSSRAAAIFAAWSGGTGSDPVAADAAAKASMARTVRVMLGGRREEGRRVV